MSPAPAATAEGAVSDLAPPDTGQAGDVTRPARRPPSARTRTVAPDAACAAAVDTARAAAATDGVLDALVPVAGGPPGGPGALVGEHLGFTVEGERVGTHWFASHAAGYPDWRWAVTVVRASRSREVTVDEVSLLPGTASLQAPAWLPWSERVTAGDLGPGDLMPTAPDDPRLEPGYTGADTDPAEVATVADELGLGRARVLSPIGRDDAADRWALGGAGAADALAVAAPAPCSTCGFFVGLGGPLRQVFGVCANLWSPRDGMVVAMDHGCGAHSDVDPVGVAGRPDTVLDTLATDGLEITDLVDLGLTPVPEDQTAPTDEHVAAAPDEPDPEPDDVEESLPD